MTAEELLSKLEAAEMVAPEVVASLRKQVGAAKEPIAVTAITKLLVDKGHLTAGQAQRLIGVPAGAPVSTIQKVAAGSAVAKAPAAAKPKPAPAATATAASNSGIHDDLGLAPLEELGSATAASTVAKSAVAKSATKSTVQPAAPAAPQPKPQITPVGLDDLGLAPLEELDAAPPAKAPAAPAAKAAPAAAPKPAPKPAASPALDDLGLAPLEELETPSAPAPAPKADPAKSAVQKAAPAKSTIQKPPAAKSSIQKPVPQSAPAAAVADLADLPPLDDLGAGLDPLGDLSSLDELSPLDADPLGGPAGLDPLGGPADLGAIAAQTAVAAQPQAAQRAAAAAATAAANESRTTLLVGVGLGAAALLAVVVGLAVYLWPRGDGMAEFQAAEQMYQEKQYAAAIEKYDELLRLHPRHDQASLVRVHRGFARILAEQGSSPNFERLLPVITAQAGELAAEPALAQIHQELGPLLVKMTESLADQATAQKPSEQSTARLDAARSALALCNDARLLPSALRPWQKLADIDERLQLAAREQGRAKFRDDFKTQLSQKLTATSGDFTPFLNEREQFLRKYPELATDPLWSELGPAIAAAANKCVKVTGDKREAEKDPASTPLLANVPWQILNARLSESPPAASDRVTLVAAAGGVHALDLQTGQPRWSRYLDASADERPLVSPDGRVAWLVDRRGPELISVSATSGNFLWSQALARAPFGPPLLLDGRLYLSLPNGQLHCFDASSGELQATAALPQSLTVGPVATADSKFILQIADEGLVYVLAAGDLKNSPANYGWLGHDRGTVNVSPTVFQQQLIVPLQRGEQTELLVVPLEAAQPTLKRQKLDGNIAAPLTVAGQRLLASTTQGKVHLLQVDPAYSQQQPDATEPFKLVQTLPGPSGAPVIRHWQRTPDGLVAADRGATLHKFDAAGKLQPGWSAFPADLFDAPLQIHDQTGVGVRFVADHNACYAAAINLTDGQPIWQTAVSVPLAVVAGNQEGSQPFAIPAPAIAKLLATNDATDLGAEFKRLLTQSSHSNLKALPIVEVLPLGDERLIVPARGARELLIVNVQDFTARKLKLPGQLAGSPAVSGAQNLLVPLLDGSIQSLSIAAGAVTAAPFVIPGNLAAAPLPVSVFAIGEEGKDALVSDGKSSLYRISLVAEPKPHWAEQAAIRLPEPLAAPPGLVAELILAVDRNGQAHSFTLPDLATGSVVDLKQGRVTWGPHQAGDCLLLATDRDELWCFDAARQPRWSQSLAAGQLVGLPLEKDNKLILTARSGRIEVRAAGSGDLTASADLQQTLAGSALLSGKTLWLTSTSGQILQTAIPTQEAKK